jgi:hypothetical protein
VPFFVRAGLRDDRWLETQGLGPLELPADVLLDLRTVGNALSIYEVTEAIAAERIAVAVAAGRREPDQTAYGIFDDVAFGRLNIPVTKMLGTTFDAAVNPLHYDVSIGSTGKLLDFAALIANSTIVPITKKRVAELLKAGFENGQLDHTRNHVLRDKVKAQIPTRSP